MKQPKWIKEGIALGEKYSNKNIIPVFHNFINVGFFLILWGAILTIWSWSLWVPIWVFFPVAVLLLGYLFYCQIVLVVHEAAHGMFIINRDSKGSRRWNRFFGWLVCIPFAIDFEDHWEKSHWLHHKFTLQSNDLEDCNVRVGKELAKRLLTLILVPGYVQFWGMITGKSSEFECARLIKNRPLIYWRGILSLVSFWVLTTLICWLVKGLNPLVVFGTAFLSVQVMAVLNVSRQALEHGGAIGKEKNLLLRTRTTLSPLRHLLAPWNLSFHFEHHLNPRVPWYALGKYSKELKKVVPEPLHSTLYNENHIFQQLAGRFPGFPNSEGRMLLRH